MYGKNIRKWIVQIGLVCRLFPISLAHGSYAYVCLCVCVHSFQRCRITIWHHTHTHTRKNASCCCLLLVICTLSLCFCVVSSHPAGTSKILASAAAAAARPHIARSNTVLRSHILHTQRFKSTFFCNTNSFVRLILFHIFAECERENDGNPLSRKREKTSKSSYFMSLIQNQNGDKNDDHKHDCLIFL